MRTWPDEWPRYIAVRLSAFGISEISEPVQVVHTAALPIHTTQPVRFTRQLRHGPVASDGRYRHPRLEASTVLLPQVTHPFFPPCQGASELNTVSSFWGPL